MPIIPLDFTGVESFDSLPLGKYAGSIDKVELRPATEEGKFDQVMVTYMVIDGEHTGRKQSEFLSLSPKAAFRLKRWIDKFEFEEDSLTGLDFDDETNLLVEPDLTAINVIFKVYEDPKLYQGEKQIRCSLEEVLPDDEPVVAPAPAARPAARPAAVRPARAAAPAPVEEDDVEDEAEAEPEPEPVPARAAAPARRAVRPAVAATGPARRTLR